MCMQPCARAERAAAASASNTVAAHINKPLHVKRTDTTP
jgi:hypothetical protein